MLRGGGRGPGGALSADGDLPDEPGCGEPARGGGGGGAFAAGVGPGPGGAVSREAAAGGGIPFVENGGWGEGAVPLGSAVAGRRTSALTPLSGADGDGLGLGGPWPAGIRALDPAGNMGSMYM